MDKTTEVGRSSRKIKGQNLVPFLAYLEKIRPEIEAGWPIKGVYNRYADALDMSYNQFVRYVNRYIKEKPAASSGVSAPKSKTERPPHPASTIHKAPTPDKPTSGFKQFIPGPIDPDPKDLW
jgi:hypothetical protein